MIFARFKFHDKVQGARKSFEQFVTELRLLVKDCDYANKDEMVRDRIVFRIHSPRVREKLLNVGSELMLDKAIDIARSHEQAQAQMETISHSITRTSSAAVRQDIKAHLRCTESSFRTERDITPKQSDTDSKHVDIVDTKCMANREIAQLKVNSVLNVVHGITSQKCAELTVEKQYTQ
jgi:hypothetical protein